MATAAVEIPQIEAINQNALSVVERAKLVIVETPEQFTLAGETLKVVVAMRKEVSAVFGPMKDAAHKAHRAICTQETKIDTPLAEAEDHVKRGMGNYMAEELRKRREEEARLQEIERKRAEAEAKAQAEEQAIQDAINAEAVGDKKGAEAFLNNPIPVAPAPIPIVLQKQVPKVEGISGRTNYRFRITNESLMPREYLKVDEQKIGQVVRIFKDKTKIPGIEVYPDASVAVRA